MTTKQKCVWTYMFIFIFYIVLVFLISCLKPKPADSKPIMATIELPVFNQVDRSTLEYIKVIKCIVGEAKGESFLGKWAVASAIRNRGSLIGVNGCSQELIHIPDIIVEDAMVAWELSELMDIIEGADSWRSTLTGEDTKIVDWNTMVFIKQIGNHKFYRSIE